VVENPGSWSAAESKVGIDSRFVTFARLLQLLAPPNSIRYVPFLHYPPLLIAFTPPEAGLQMIFPVRQFIPGLRRTISFNMD
jgi:hypothetical protein